jgi:peptide/nickel transport system ATP-binding protein
VTVPTLAADRLIVTVPGTSIRILDGVDLALHPRRIHALVGESGSGKTTLLRALSGLVPISGGQIRCGTDVVARPGQSLGKAIARTSAMLFQDPLAALSPRRTVAQLLLDTLTFKGVARSLARRRAEELLGMVGLAPAFLTRYPFELSGGQARRVAFARALAQDPRILLADEPTAGLDMSLQGEIMGLIRTARDELGLAILIVTHNLSVVRHLADEVTVLYLGQVMEHGPSAEVAARPAHPYTRVLTMSELRTAAPLDPMAVPTLAEPPSLHQRQQGCAFANRCPQALAQCDKVVPPEQHFAEGRRSRCHLDAQQVMAMTGTERVLPQA